MSLFRYTKGWEQATAVSVFQGQNRRLRKIFTQLSPSIPPLFFYENPESSRLPFFEITLNSGFSVVFSSGFTRPKFPRFSSFNNNVNTILYYEFLGYDNNVKCYWRIPPLFLRQLYKTKNWRPPLFTISSHFDRKNCSVSENDFLLKIADNYRTFSFLFLSFLLKIIIFTIKRMKNKNKKI